VALVFLTDIHIGGARERGLCAKKQNERKKTCMFFAMWSVNSKCKMKQVKYDDR